MLSSAEDSAYSSSPAEATHRARLASFLGLMVPSALFFIALEALTFWLYRGVAHAIAVLLCCFCVVWIMRARAAVQRNDMRRAIIMSAIGFFSVPPVAVLIWPEIRPTIILLPLLVVTVAFPYLQRGDLLRLALLAWAVIITSSLLSELAVPSIVVPNWYVSLLRTTSLASVSALLLLLFWVSSARIKELFFEISQENRALSSSEGHFRASFEQAAVGMAHVSATGRWLRVNSKLCSLVGYSPLGLQSLTMRELTHPEDQAVVEAHVARLLAGEDQSFSIEKRLLCANGATIWVSLSVSLIRDGKGLPGYLLAVVEDISARKQAEEQRALLYDESQRAIEMRDEFFTVAAHELRTPITTILGSAQLLERRLDSANAPALPALRTVGALIDQVHRLSRLSAALLDVSRMQETGLRISLAPLDVRPVVQQLVDEFAPTLERHELDLRLSPEPCMLLGDRLRLEQILQNVIHNAVKYSPEGGTILIGVERDGAYVRVSVADPGIGIPDEEIHQIFGRFYRATNIKGLRLSGMGVGLYIVHELVRLHGGEIQVQSEQGRGTRFEMTFPAA